MLMGVELMRKVVTTIEKLANTTAMVVDGLKCRSQKVLIHLPMLGQHVVLSICVRKWILVQRPGII